LPVLGLKAGIKRGVEVMNKKDVWSYSKCFSWSPS